MKWDHAKRELLKCVLMWRLPGNRLLGGEHQFKKEYGSSSRDTRET